MRTFSVLSIVAMLLLLGGGCISSSTEYGICSRSVTEGVVISNKEFEARFSLNSGRLIFFGSRGGENLLWINSCREFEEYNRKKTTAYLNLGGEKLWPLAQCNWRAAFGREWPPPVAFEGVSWRELCRTERSLTVESSLIPMLNIVITRKFTLSPSGAELTVRNRIHRFASSPFPIQIWSITQLQMPKFCIMELPADAPEFIEYSARGYARNIAGKRLVRQDTCDKAEGAKSGTLGSFVGAVYPDGKVLLQYSPVVRNGCYPEGASVQLYSNPYYMEIETLDEQIQLLPGEERENQIVWKFFDTGINSLDEKKLYDAVDCEVKRLKTRFSASSAL